MKKMYLTHANNTYKLTYNTDTKVASNVATNSINSLLSAYLLDYDLSHSALSLSATYTNLAKSTGSSSVLYTTDNTIYQDSFNNYLLALSTTSLTTTYNNYTYRPIRTQAFSTSL